uniref:Uncharacterized protein n=1 Tax=Arundo donax TaxID=35708 RepID=A0A0A9G1Y7_ARUDO
MLARIKVRNLPIICFISVGAVGL